MQLYCRSAGRQGALSLSISDNSIFHYYNEHGSHEHSFYISNMYWIYFISNQSFMNILNGYKLVRLPYSRRQSDSHWLSGWVVGKKILDSFYKKKKILYITGWNIAKVRVEGKIERGFVGSPTGIPGGAWRGDSVRDANIASLSRRSWSSVNAPWGMSPSRSGQKCTIERGLYLNSLGDLKRMHYI